MEVVGCAVAYIPLTQGQVALIDVADFLDISRYKWTAMYVKKMKAYYAVRRGLVNGKHRLILMHREILRAEPDSKVDHKNRNTLDNRRENLRPATHTQNMSNSKRHSNNTSGYCGVSWMASKSAWRVRVGNKHIGLFRELSEAVSCRNSAALAAYGEFAHLNILEAPVVS